jgi:diguanylate cyclase (GGDEF)-like protein
MLLPNVGTEEEARRVADRALAALAEPFGQSGQVSRLGCSIGIALSPGHGTELTILMKAADLAMYQAKARGRSRACLFGESTPGTPRLARAS